MTDDIEPVIAAWITAWFQKDAGTVEALMAPEYRYLAPNGQVLDAGRILQIIRSPGYALSSGSRSEVRLMQVTPDVVVVTDRWQGTGTFEGRSFTDDHRCTRVWVRRQGRWRLAHEHCSAMSP